MRPEDIDKIFKERLGNSAPTPPADMWARLQERMEEEKPMMAIVPEEGAAPKQVDGSRRFMWLSSSIAATLSLLLAVSVVFYNINTGTPEINEALTRHDSKLILEQPIVEPAVAPELATSAQQEPVVDEALTAASETEVEKNEKNVAAQATAEETPASIITKTPVKTGLLAKTSPKPVQQQKMASAPVNKVSDKVNGQPALATNTTLESPTSAAQMENAFTPKADPSTAVAKANLNAEPVEIIIKRSVSSQTAMAEENSTTPDDSGKRVKLAKSIFKQVRNLASGEEVELSALGIRADRVALETQIGKQKISKVINL